MSVLYVYALLAAPGSGRLTGIAKEAVRTRSCGSLWAAVGEMAAPPPLEPAMLRGHDLVIRRLARRAPAILPARFGSVVASEAELSRQLAPRASALAEALCLVEGREQMTLRAYSRAAREEPVEPSPPGLDPADTAEPGTRYLLARQRALALPELDRLRSALGGLAAAERIDRHGTPPLIASVYHLIPRGQARAYRAAVQAVRASLPLRVRASGPWPPYAFAPETLS